MTAAPADVFIGHQDYLFLSGGQHRVLEYFNGAKAPAPASVANFHANMKARRNFCHGRGIPFSACVFPEKIYALRHLLPDGDLLQSIYLRHYAPQHPEGDTEAIVYPLQQLDGKLAHFTRTDTHYSIPGVVAITRHLLQCNLPEAVEVFTEKTEGIMIENPAFSGDLGRKFSPRRSESVLGLDRSKLPNVLVGSNGVETGNDGLLILRHAPEAAIRKTLLIFGDSFFRQLLPFLSLVFEKVIFCRTRFFHEELIPALAPDIIWTGLAERYLSRCQPDTQRPHFLSYPLVRGKSLSPDATLGQLWPDFFKDKLLL